MGELKIKKKEIGSGRPLLCVPVMEGRTEDVVREMQYLSESCADMIEWRVDAFEQYDDCNAVREVLERAAEFFKDRIFLYTFRSRKQGGLAQAGAEQLKDLYDLAAESGCVDLADFEYFEETHPHHRIRQLKKKGLRVVASHHDFERTPETEVMRMLLEQMCEGEADIVKLAVMPQSEEDVLRLLDVTVWFRRKYPDTPLITMSMGRLGSVSRLCGEIFGSCVTFGSHEKPSAPGQYQMDRLCGMLDMIHESNQ